MARDHYWAVYSHVSKKDVFGIKAFSKRKALQALFNKIGKDAYKWRFEIRKRKIKQPKKVKNLKTNSRRNFSMSNTKIITGEVRFSYLHAWEPHAVEEGQDKKYSVSLLIPKSDKKTIAAIEKAIEAAKADGKSSKFGGKIPSNLKLPLRDGDTEREDDPNYAGHYFINASSKNKPGIVDKDINPILDQNELYSGCYGRASINFYAFNVSGNRGIAAGLNNLQKLRDGESLSGGASAEDDFSDGFGDTDEDDLLG